MFRIELSWAGEIVTAASGVDQMKRPRLSRFESRHAACLSCQIVFYELQQRQRSTKRFPECGSAFLRLL